jgi:hypothetical protein
MWGIWNTIKKIHSYGYRRKEEIQTKGIDNLLNKIIAENFPSLEKWRDIQVQEAYRIANCQYHKKHSQIYHNQNIQ